MTSFDKIREALDYNIDTPDDVLAAALSTLTELAAAVAERDRLRDSDAFSRSELVRGNEIIDSLRIERDELCARLAAIDNAPTVAIVDSTPRGSVIRFAKNPFIGAELIARPAKESP